MTTPIWHAPAALFLGTAMLLAPAPGLGETPQLSIELNSAEGRDNGCQLVFVMQDGTGAGLEQLVLEVVLFDRTGGVSALSLLDFQDLPADGTRVRSFNMPGLECGTLGRLLVNAVAACAPQGATGCEALKLSSRIDTIEVLQ